MALSWSDWESAMSNCNDLQKCGGVAFQMEPLCPSNAEWAKFCQAVMKIDFPKAVHEEASVFAKKPKEINAALVDNYFWAAVYLVLGNANRSLPVLPPAASNKHEFKGWADECAVVRFLTWAGFDAKASDEKGQTALHYMAAWNNPPFSNPRAVDFLLRAGADANARNSRGDSPLAFLSGSVQWSEELRESAFLLLDAGANPLLQANDGATPLSLLQDAGKTTHQPKRGEVIAKIESIILGGLV